MNLSPAQEDKISVSGNTIDSHAGSQVLGKGDLLALFDYTLFQTFVHARLIRSTEELSGMLSLFIETWERIVIIREDL